ncbi:MAG: hypothetical protein AB4058_07375 [Microcystaceae cyanobacterium]
MFKKSLYFFSIVNILSSLFVSPVSAQSCTPLNLVGGEGSQVRKTASQPTVQGPFGVTITRNNWNTDWVIPTERSWKSFIVNVNTDKEQTMTVRVYLKYPDQTSDQFLNEESVTISPQKPLKLTLTPRKDIRPYQVNVFVGDVGSFGKTYTASVSGCI